MLLQGKVAMVSGVGPGLSRSVALLFAEHGARVVLGARTESTLKTVADEIEARGGEAVWATADVTDPASCRELTQSGVDAFGAIDVLVNVAADIGVPGPFMESDLARWRQAMDVSYWGALNMTREAVPHMRERGGGRVIMINSMSVRRSDPNFGAYVGAKAALEGIVRVLAGELGPDRITVNSVFPGYIYSDATKAMFARMADQRGVDARMIYDEIAALTCLKAVPTPDEIAGTVLFLASDLAAPVTGQGIDVNAGQAFH
jgi:NAD(P)-dependent dehydrogenase (short-subunit alcohol dehydrogenase family)